MIDLTPACGRMTELLAGISDDQLDEAAPCDHFADLAGRKP